MKETEAMVKFLRQVQATGKTSGKWALVNSANNRKLIEIDRNEGYRVLYRLTAEGERLLSR